MFDLVNLLNQKETAEQKQKEKITSVLFYETERCKNLVQEAYRFDGIIEPEISLNRDKEIIEHVNNSAIEIVIVELNHSLDVALDAERISHLLPNNASVIVIGSEDAISTIRKLKEMGFYYLFWPITKQELIDFVRSVSSNRVSNRGPGQNRKAKQVSIIGSKGGVGTTLLATDIAMQLTQQKSTSCTLVDHNYLNGNIDIMLGIKRFTKRAIQKGELSNVLDSSVAQSLVYKHNEMLSLLALTSEDISTQDLSEYTNSVIDLVSMETHFIIEDLSSSVGFDIGESAFISDCDCIVLVLEPTVSALRDAARLKTRIEENNSNESLRLLIVVNHSHPERTASVTLKDIEKLLVKPIDVVIPYCLQANQTIMSGQLASNSSLKMAMPLKNLASLILGEVQTEKTPKWRQWLPLSLEKRG